MSKHWLEANSSRLMAEILRDFCAVNVALEEQFVRFDHAGNLSYAVLREILGDQMNRGILWRLKDTAHHLLRDAPDNHLAGRLLDWAIGYLFHETWKLMENTHQHQYYALSLIAMVEGHPASDLDAVARDFTLMAVENQTEMGNAAIRIRRLLAHARQFFHRCCASQAENTHLARFLYDKENLVREAFSGDYEALVDAVYGANPQLLFIYAGTSLLHGGRLEEAHNALERAKALAPDDPRLTALAQALEKA